MAVLIGARRRRARSASRSAARCGSSSPTRSTPVAQPSVPVLTIALIALGALVLANLVAAIPGRVAARTRTATLLRAE